MLFQTALVLAPLDGAHINARLFDHGIRHAPGVIHQAAAIGAQIQNDRAGILFIQAVPDLLKGLQIIF